MASLSCFICAASETSWCGVVWVPGGGSGSCWYDVAELATDDAGDAHGACITLFWCHRDTDAAAVDDWCYVAIPTEFSVNEPKTVMPLQHAFFIFSIEMLAMKQVWRKIHRRGRPPNCHFLPGPHLTRGSFFGPTRVYIPNGTLIIRFCI